MSYLQALADELTCYTPNIVWEYVKAYLYGPRKGKCYRRIENGNIYEKYREEVNLLLEANGVGLNTDRIRSPADPPWLDGVKLARGQEFGRRFYFSICYSNMVSLYLLFSHDRSLRPLILTKRSGDVESAYKRYMSTIHRVKTWYEHDLTDEESEARKNLRKVNNYHLAVASRLGSMTEEEFLKASELESPTESDGRCYENIRQVMRNNHLKIDERLLRASEEGLHLSQAHMAVTQFGFMGLVVLYPRKFGVTDLRDLDCFVHLWRYIGYLLGIEDKYNLCDGTLDRVSNRCTFVLECVLKPCMSTVNSSWEHMSICACKGIDRAFKRLLFQATLAFLLDCIDLNFDCFYASMTLNAKLKYHFVKFLFSYLISRETTRKHLTDSLNLMLEREKIFS